MSASKLSKGYLEGKVSDPKYVSMVQAELAWQEAKAADTISFVPLDSDVYEKVRFSPEIDEISVRDHSGQIALKIGKGLDYLKSFKAPEAYVEIGLGAADPFDAPAVDDPFANPAPADLDDEAMYIEM